MIPGQNAQAAGIEPHALVDPVFQREIRDAGGGWERLPVALADNLGIESFLHFLMMAQEAFIGRQNFESLLRPAAGEVQGIRRRLFPKLGMNAAEEFNGVGIPAPPQVSGQRLEELEFLRNRRSNVE